MSDDAAKGTTPLGIIFNPFTYLSVPNLAYFALALAVHGAGLFPLAPTATTGGATLRADAARTVGYRCALTAAVYSAWHYLLYVRAPPAAAAGAKFNPKYPPAAAHRENVLFTMGGTVVGALFDVALLAWAAARGAAPLDDAPVALSFARAPARFVALAVFAAFVSDIHFWCVHRFMHPWRLRGLPRALDGGAWLYRHVHSLHHRNRNPGPWSGLSMHPVEHLLYFSRALWVLPCHWLGFPAHSVHFLFTVLRATLGPAPGHHGFEKLGGSRFHYLHHLHVECNYGTRGSMDKLFGTFRE